MIVLSEATMGTLFFKDERIDSINTILVASNMTPIGNYSNDNIKLSALNTF